MSLRSGGDYSQPHSADELAVEAELRAYAARVTPMPSAAFVDRVVTASERSPRPVALRSPGAWANELVHAAGGRLRVALAQVAGGSSVPLRLRLQAGAMLFVVALLITAGVAMAAAGATTVVTWATAPQAPAAGSGPSPSPSQSPTLGPAPSKRAPQSSDHPGNKPSSNPGNHGQPSQNPGNGKGSAGDSKPTATAHP